MRYANFLKHISAVCLILSVIVVCVGVSAKRKPAPIVKSITHDRITYSAQGDGVTGYVVATGAISGEELWRAKIYTVRVNPALEFDVQQIFISGLKLAGERLLIRDEAGRCYQLDISKRSANGVSCSVYRAAPIPKD